MLQIKTALLDIKTALPKIDTALLRIENQQAGLDLWQVGKIVKVARADSRPGPRTKVNSMSKEDISETTVGRHSTIGGRLRPSNRMWERSKADQSCIKAAKTV